MNNQVSGAHRFKFFSNAFTLPHSPPSAIFCIENEKRKEHDQQELKSHQPQSKFKTTSVQTKLSLTNARAYSKKQKTIQKEPLGGKHVNLRQIPPVSEFGSIEEYKSFLIQVQMEDIKCREEQINKDIEHRLKEKKKELEKRYSKQDTKINERKDTVVLEKQEQQNEVQAMAKTTTSNDEMAAQAKVKSCANLFPSRRYPTREKRETSKRKIAEHKNSLEFIESII